MKHLSISQIKLFREDPFEWAFRYLERLRPDSSEALEFGSSFAYSIESIVTKEPYPSEGRYGHATPWRTDAAMLAYEWAKENKDLLNSFFWEAEYPFSVHLDPDLPKFIGAIDLCVLRTLNNVPIIKDFKTVTESILPNHKFWGLSEEDLKTDLQLCLYAYVVMQELNAEEAVVGHFQIVKQKKYGKIVGFRLTEVENYVTIKEVKEIIEGIIETGHQMVEAKTIWEVGGMEALRRKYPSHKQQRSFGQVSEFWNWWIGRETLDDLIIRMK
jgi:hypothetical protein